ncbi:unnamed protein product [Rotaria sp. Silwood1]|nr:unnamed protein product [Rotaria sp. Silwood1]
MDITTPKCTRDAYKLQQSILNFQLVRVDQNNIASLTDCFCQTESIYEIEANGQRQIDKSYKVNTIKSKILYKKQKI